MIAALQAVAPTLPDATPLGAHGAPGLERLNQAAASTAPAAPGPSRRHAAASPSSARTAPRRSPRRRRAARRRRTFFAAHSVAELAGQVRLLARRSRAGSPSRWCCARARPLRADRLGRRVRAASPTSCTRSTRPTRRSSTPRAAPATRPRSSTSSSSAASAPTTCPTARTCATSRAASALAETIGIGKGTVTLDDFEHADLIFVVGQNPGTNHPRMLTALEKRQAQRRQDRRDQPAARGRADALQEPAAGPRRCSAAARRSPTCSCRSASAATWRCSRRHEARCSRPRTPRPGSVLDHAFIARAHRRASTSYARARRGRSTGTTLERASGVSRGADRARPPTIAGASKRIDRVLGDGPDPAPHARRHDPRDRQPAAAARQHRPPGAGRLPGARPLQRAGRPHDGHLGAAAATAFLDALGARVRLRAARASTASTPSTRSAPCATAGRSVFIAHGRQLRCAPPPTPTSPRRRCAAAR